MERRDFFKLVGTASGAVVTGACGKRAQEILPVLIPAQEIVPGVESWHPGVCKACGAGCGILVRVMEAERQIERNSEKVRERIAAIKKIEGNPLDPVSGGRLCARGQAAVQSLYHPDRLKGPLKRSGKKGEATFTPISWDEALNQAAAALKHADPSHVLFFARPEEGARSSTIASFLKALGAPPAATLGVGDFTVERKAVERVFGWSDLPLYDIQTSDLVLGLGADFLAGWVSPVFYSRQFGHMRQGRQGRRGRLVHAESRFSITAGASDEWLPVRPGGELGLALAIGHVLVREKLARDDRRTAALRDAFASVDFDRAAGLCGLAPERIVRVARDLGGAENPVVVAGASIIHARSLDAVVAGNALNWLLGSVGRKGGVLPPPAEPDRLFADTRPRFRDALAQLKTGEIVFLDGVNPVFTLPASAGSLAKAPFVVSFSSFLDDSAAYVDFVLPDHDPLESAAVAVPPAAPGMALTGARPFIRPLYDTRPAEQVLLELARRMGHEIEADTPERAYERFFAEHKPAGEWSGAADFAGYCDRQGGWWVEDGRDLQATAPSSLPRLTQPECDGDPARFPLHFQPYPTLQFGDGSGANLPWLQELPDPGSSAMWGLPVEVDPRTARGLGLANGDLVQVISPHGQLTAPVYIHPAAIPGVVSMGIGQGHAVYTRYASGRGANPLTITAAAAEKECGVFAFAATRVRLERAGPRGGLVQFSYMDREPELRR